MLGTFPEGPRHGASASPPITRLRRPGGGGCGWEAPRPLHGTLFSQTPFHLQLDWACPLDTLLEVLVSVLRAHAWEDVVLVLCRVRDPGGLVALWTSQAGRAPQFVLDLGRLGPEAADIQARLAPLGAPVPVAVLLGCDAPHALRVLEAAPLGPHWLLGTPLAAEALPTTGLPPGLLALGEVAQPPLEAAVHDAVELIARALGTAASVQPDRALLPARASCEDPQAPRPDSSRRLLAR